MLAFRAGPTCQPAGQASAPAHQLAGAARHGCRGRLVQVVRPHALQEQLEAAQRGDGSRVLQAGGTEEAAVGDAPGCGSRANACADRQQGTCTPSSPSLSAPAVRLTCTSTWRMFHSIWSTAARGSPLAASTSAPGGSAGGTPPLGAGPSTCGWEGEQVGSCSGQQQHRRHG